MRSHLFISKGRRARVLLMAALLAGCQGQPPAPSSPADKALHKELTTIAAGTLINEGGPVFALPGTVKLPGYFSGTAEGLAIGAERLDGGTFALLAAGSYGLLSLQPIAADGSFTLKGRVTSQLFFAATEFRHAHSLHRMRVLGRAEPGDPLLLDTASTLVAAKIALAAQARKLDDLSFAEAHELTSQVRAALGTALDDIRLDQTNQALSSALTDLAARSPGLSTRLSAWEAAIGLAGASSPSPTPGASPMPGASPTSGFDPK